MKHGWLLGFAFAASVSGCALFNVGTGSSTTTTSGAGGSAVSGAVTGVSCGPDPGTGATLCLGISSCPGLTIDSETFPGCGFLISGTAIDLRCVCGGSLCPIGVAATCAAATMLLAGTNVGAVCSQTDSCVEVASSTTSASSSSGSSTCDQGCAGDCAADPTCLEACGC